MPTYEYVCESCDNHWEEIQKITENALDECPKCHNKTAKRQISGGGFILKGGGWYADLYSSSSKPKAKKEEGDSSKSETKADAGAGESKTTSTEPSGSSAPAAPAAAAPAATPTKPSTAPAKP